MNQISFVIAAYAVAVPALIWLVAASYRAMRKAEATVDRKEQDKE